MFRYFIYNTQTYHTMKKLLIFTISIVLTALCSRAQIITTIGGNGIAGYSGDGGMATSASINTPQGIVFDTSGNLIFSDYANHRIRKINTAGIITTIAGTGTWAYTGDGGPATAATLSRPTGLAIDNIGNLFIVDPDNNCIRKIDPSGIISTVAGNGIAGFSGDDGPATAAQLNFPYGVVLDNMGSIIIAEKTNNRLRKVDSLGIITTIAGTGSVLFGGDGGPATAASFNPFGVGIDYAMNLYVIGNSRIRKINSSGIINTIAGTGALGYSGDGGPATAAQLNNPFSIVVDSFGDIYFPDQANNRIRAINPSGVIKTIAGTGVLGYSGDGGPATAAKMNSPFGIMIDKFGSIYISDQNNNRIRKITCSIPYSGIISGLSSVCVGSTITLTNTTTGGIWSSTNAYATVIGGVVTGISAGIDTINYTTSNDCGTATATATFIVTINPLPIAGTIVGASSLCTGTTTTLTDIATGGVWSATNGHAIVSGGIVSGITTGVDTILYIVINSCGAATSSNIVTINPSPSAGSISGLVSVCQSSSINLTDGVIGGIWTSSNTTIATIGSSGIVTGVSSGSTIISYAVTNTCGTAYSTQLITVNPLPTAGTITGAATVCVGSTILLTDFTMGGFWSATNGNAIIASGGVVYGMIAGVDTISYTYTNSCGTAVVTKTVTVNPLPNAGTINGLSNVCVSSTITLSDIVSGGTWNSSNTAIGTIGSSGIVTGINAGTTTISYSFTNSCGSATTTKIVTINPLPNAGTISGVSNLCVGSSTTLTDGVIGGTWVASNGNAIITSGGSIYGMAIGVDTISYVFTNSCGIATVIKIVTINPLPIAGTITGEASICAGTTTTLSDAATGGTWTSSTLTSATVGSTGIVTGVAVGSSTITYTVINSCGTAIATHLLVVNPLPNAGSIIGPTSVCTGSNITLSDTTTGGTWTASNSNATVSSVGDVYGLISGVDTIYYHTSNSCGTAMASKTITINPMPIAAGISGSSEVCVSASVLLTDMSTGGIWSVTNSNASIGSTGIVTGVISGFDTVRYTVINSCGSDTAVHVITITTIPNAGTITGVATVCTGSSIALTDAVVGGIWTSSNSHGIVSSFGIVTGITGGLDTIKYIVTNACGSSFAIKIVTINASPNAGSISGPSSVCVDAHVILTDLSPGGVWSSTNGDATIASGTVSGVSSGTDTIKYTVSNSCGTAVAEFEIVVEPLPHAGTITGLDTLCAGMSIMLSDTSAGGIWSSVTGAATVSSTGLVTGLHSGVDTVRYTVTNSCGSVIAKRPILVRQAGDCTTAVALSTGATDISVMPNPNKGLFTIKGAFAGMSDNEVTIEVSSMLGQTVYKRQLITKEGIINESIQLSNSIANGMYLLTIISGNEVKMFHVVVEQ